ncbi:hypothetical protein BpHYR1_052627 [Brachionus plicatilis]|uniref:Uncharacterized protein n=1 Tax=Brachionus plicatilis TaxID=10195 RepID=A0A3M7R5M0_BRAPC|nr:hypothetical protein BpHYR1_052627 [Brachionus plicatilis]
MFSTSFGNDILTLLTPFFLSGLYFSSSIISNSIKEGFKSMILEIRGQEVKTKSTIPSEIRKFICIFKSENSFIDIDVTIENFGSIKSIAALNSIIQTLFEEKL